MTKETGNQHVVEAATVITFRNAQDDQPEILMTQRAKDLSFAGSAVVFPGGKIHNNDRLLADKLWPNQIDGTARIAAIRELIEETGLVFGTNQSVSAEQAVVARKMLANNEDLAPVLDHFGWTLDLDALTAFARWVPTFKPGRIFDTRFYLADIGTGAIELMPDLSETSRLFWVTAKDALTLIDAEEVKAIYPTRRNLERLAQFGSYSEAKLHALCTSEITISPWIEESEQGTMLRIPDGAGYPITSAPLSQIKIDP